MKSKALIVILLLCCSGLAFSKSDPWGELKRIHFYDSARNYSQVLVHLDAIDFDQVKRSEQQEIAARLIRFGDYYLEKGNYGHSEAFYRKVLALSPQYWYLYNKLDKINRAKGSWLFGFDNLFKQVVMVVKNFETSFLMMNHTFNIMFFSGLLVFFLFGLVMFIRYFRLAGNDLLINEDGGISYSKAAVVSVIVLWPVLFMAGWMIYPFLLTGFLWLYLNDNEKKAVKYMVIVVVGLTVLYGLNLTLENSFKADSFKTVQKVYDGHLFGKDDYNGFDNKLKIAQAFSYYENEKYDIALDLLNATGESYKSTLKYNLMGNIYYRYGEFSQSKKYYSESLKMNDKNPIALNNFTLALLKDHNPTVFQSYAKRYPEIERYRSKELYLKEIKLRRGVLWGRLFNFSGDTFSLGKLVSGTLGECFKLPVFYFLILFILYVTLLKKITPNLGESTFCSKCSRIIKEASVHRSYKLCDECYQLFSIKDVIFLEAKILKEKELKKKFKKKFFVFILFSVLIPGLNFSQRENNRLFVALCGAFYFLLGFAVVGFINFDHIFSASPLFLNLFGIIAVGFYFFVNLFSVLGDKDGI